MGTVLLALGRTLGKTLWSMLLALLTGPMIRSWITMGLEAAVSKFERKAKKTADPEDDIQAAQFRKALERAKKAWGQK